MLDRTKLMDPLSQLISTLDVEGVLSTRLELSGDWSFSFPITGNIKLGAVVSGECSLRVEGNPEVTTLRAGDFYVLSGFASYAIASGRDFSGCSAADGLERHLQPDGVVRYGAGSEKTVLIGARFTISQGMSLLPMLVPPFAHVAAGGDRSSVLKSLLQLVYLETGAPQIGRDVVGSSLSKIVLVNALRASLAAGQKPTPWISALADPVMGPVIELLHQSLFQRWKVDDLARTAGMSRTSFNERFKTLTTKTPLNYLITMRMEAAKTALERSDRSVSSIANEIGYQSESAFSNAFKRAVGVSPQHYRERKTASVGRGPESSG